MDTTPFHRKVLDGQCDGIEEVFQSFERHFPFHLKRNKGRHNNSKLQLIIKFLLAAHGMQKIQTP
jgi:hypothetical protein